MSITWAMALGLPRFADFEDPSGQGHVPKACFAKAFQPVLNELDGSDPSSFIDFFFCESPMREGLWEFVDEDARLDFFDYCQDLGCSPSLEEIQAGEDHRDKAARTRLENQLKSGTKHAVVSTALDFKTVLASCHQSSAEAKSLDTTLSSLSLSGHQKYVKATKLKLGSGKSRSHIVRGARSFDDLVKRLEELNAKLGESDLTVSQRKRIKKKKRAVIREMEWST